MIVRGCTDRICAWTFQRNLPERYVQCPAGTTFKFLGFVMDCGHAFTAKYGNAANDFGAQERIIRQLTGISLPGSAIYSRRRYFRVCLKNRKGRLLPINGHSRRQNPRQPADCLAFFPSRLAISGQKSVISYFQTSPKGHRARFRQRVQRSFAADTGEWVMEITNTEGTVYKDRGSRSVFPAPKSIDKTSKKRYTTTKFL